MKRETAKSRIAETLYAHSVIQLPGIQVDRAKCRCGWSAQGHKQIVDAKVSDHQSTAITVALFGYEAEIVEE